MKGMVKLLKPLNEMNLSFDSYSSNEAFARSAVAAFVTQLDPTVSELNELRTAVSEAVTNCVVHAYRDTIGKISINVKIISDTQITVKIRDSGCGIRDVRQAMEPLYTTAPDEERAGLGFAVMQSFSDSVSVRSVIGKGTTVTLKKKLSRRINNA